jgi:signal transduction histidine kinase
VEKELRQTNAELIVTRAELQLSLADLQRSNAELQKTQLQLIEAAKLESVGRLAAGVAHEVKNPLMTLSLGADYFVRRGSGRGDEAILLQDMKEAVHRASTIINRLLDFTKPRPLQRTPEDLNIIIENSVSLVRHQLLEHQVTVECQLQPGLPLLALDRTRIEQVFVNLFLNAVQAMPEGGTLTVRTRVCVSPANNGEPACVTVDVDDTGQGIPHEHLAKLFEPFFTTKPPGQGSGLGLAIVRKIVEIHGGSISLCNRAESGARATVKFNL